MKYIFLTPEFYQDYSNCKEIAQKYIRPYMAVMLEVGGITYAIPFRSHIRHKHAFITDKDRQCGLDYSKTVVVLRSQYISLVTPTLREKEHKALLGREYEIKRGLMLYIRNYKKARERLDIPRNRLLCEFSTLQYFEDYI